VSRDITSQFIAIYSLEKAFNLENKKCHITWGIRASVTKGHTGEEVSKIEQKVSRIF